MASKRLLKHNYSLTKVNKTLSQLEKVQLQSADPRVRVLNASGLTDGRRVHRKWTC